MTSKTLLPIKCFVEKSTKKNKKDGKKPHESYPNTWKKYIVFDEEISSDWRGRDIFKITISLNKQFKGCPKNKKIGLISIEEDFPHYVSRIRILKKYRGHGLGKMLYLKALDKVKYITTSSESSFEARRTWSSIMKERPFVINWASGEIIFFKNHYWMKKYNDLNRMS